jgi:hypothetical protein
LRAASCIAISLPIPEDAPVTTAQGPYLSEKDVRELFFETGIRAPLILNRLHLKRQALLTLSTIVIKMVDSVNLIFFAFTGAFNHV